MSVQISRGDDEQILYCSTTMQAFGPVHTREDCDLEDFLEWLGEDPRHLSDTDLSNKYWDWIRFVEQEYDDWMMDKNDGPIGG